MILFDENIPDSQRHLLRGWRIRVHQIGHEIGRSGMKDKEIIPPQRWPGIRWARVENPFRGRR